MANPTEVGISADNLTAVYSTATTAADVTIDPNKLYWIQHNGATTGGAAATGAVYLNLNGTASVAEGKGRAVLPNGKYVYVSPSANSTMSIASASGNPGITIVPLKDTKGEW